MDIRQLSPEVSVTGQITARDLDALMAQGFRSVICNRPDGEEPGQPTVASIEAAAKEKGLAFRSIPVVHGSPCIDESAAFAKALAEMPGPVLAYCRSGARSANLWSLARGRG